MRTCVCILFLSLFLACGCHSRSDLLDKNGHTPEDVVMLFVTAVSTNDYDKASGYWTKTTLARIKSYCDSVGENYTNLVFNDFRGWTRERLDGHWGKVDYYHVWLDEPTGRYLTLYKFDGEWLFTRGQPTGGGSVINRQIEKRSTNMPRAEAISKGQGALESAPEIGVSEGATTNGTADTPSTPTTGK